MIKLVGLLLVLVAMWFALSGETAPLFLALAALSIGGVIVLAYRLRIVDSEGSPYGRFFQLFGFFLWEDVEIAKSSFTVMRLILSPRAKMSPAIVSVPMSERSGLARALYANAISLTPGTLTLSVHPDHIVTHVMLAERAPPEAFKVMDELTLRAAEGERR